MNTDLNFKCKSINYIEPANNYHVNIDITIPNFEISAILDQIGYEKIYNNIDIAKILDIIGKDECKSYFDLIDVKD